MSISNDAALEALDALFGRLTFSVAQYTIDSDPYVTDDDKKVIGVIKEIAASDAAEVAECARLIESLDGIPQAGAPNPRLAEMNYLSYPYILDVLISEISGEASHFARIVEGLEPATEAHAFVSRIAAARAEQLKRLQDLRTSVYPAAEAVASGA